MPTERQITFPRVRTSTEKAFQLYHTLPYFMTKDIKELFGCSYSTAGKIKRVCGEEMEKRGIRCYCEKNEFINKDVLFDLAGINISQLNKDYAQLMKFRKEVDVCEVKDARGETVSLVTG